MEMRVACLTVLSLILNSSLLAQEKSLEAPLPSQLNKIMQARYSAGGFNGTVLVARQGKIIYEHAFGLANREWNIPNDLQTKFEIGSMTKQFTAMLILQFVNEGKIRLDGRIPDYLPYY